MFRKCIFFKLLFVLALNLPMIAAQDVHSLQVDGTERTYELFVPSSVEDTENLSLVIILHPAASSGKAMVFLSGFNTLAEEYGFIVAYPDSNGAAWGEDVTDASLPDDVGFISALVDNLQETYDIGEVHLAGMGNGGLMAYRLACETPENFRSIAVVGSLMWDYHLDNCPPNPLSPHNFLLIHGSEDPFYFEEGAHSALYLVVSNMRLQV